jgi:hypothetical protein
MMLVIPITSMKVKARLGLMAMNKRLRLWLVKSHSAILSGTFQS